jgi:hypothetical protein
MTGERRRISNEAVLATVVTLAGWVFTSGMLYERLRDIDAREQKIEQKVDQLQNWIAAVNVDKARQEEADRRK